MKDDDDEEETTASLVVHIIVTKEEDEKKQPGRPSAYWAQVREAEEEPDTFGGGFRGVPAPPHGGTTAVTARNTLGADDLCWCGDVVDHDWPGKDKGRRHPKQTKEGTSVNTRMAEKIDRRDLRAYHARLQDFVMQCVNDDGLRFRVGKNSVILYPTDGTNPATVYARKSDHQVRQLQKWYVAHVYSAEKEAVEPEQVEALAKVVNDPKEHPVEVPAVEPEAEWHPWIHREHGGEHELIETDGTRIRCTHPDCVGSEHEYLDQPRSIGGHMRMWHTDRSTMYTPEAREKAATSSRARKQREDAITQAIKLLAPLVPEVFPDHSEELEALARENVALVTRVEELEHELAEAKAGSDQVEALRTRAEEAEARLALMREALGV